MICNDLNGRDSESRLDDDVYLSRLMAVSVYDDVYLSRLMAVSVYEDAMKNA